MGEDILIEHILDSHTLPDNAGLFRCNECPYGTKSKRKLGEHHKVYHRSQNSEDQNKELITEYKQLKINFQRLEGLYKEAFEEAEKTKADFESRLLVAGEEKARLVAKNEILEEKIEILYKLSKSYIDNKSNTTDSNTSLLNRDVDPGTIEVVEVVESDNRCQTQVSANANSWQTTNLRGFKRKNNSPSHPTHPEETEQSIPVRSKSSHDENPVSEVDHHTPVDERSTPVRYCHYFSKTGRCDYEERSGLKCKFTHKQAPMCHFGTNCPRQKCMFTHPQTRPILRSTNNLNDRSFLGTMRNTNQLQNPWQNQNLQLNHWQNQNQQLNPSQNQNQQLNHCTVCPGNSAHVNANHVIWAQPRQTVNDQTQHRTR